MKYSPHVTIMMMGILNKFCAALEPGLSLFIAFCEFDNLLFAIV